jgi:endonuclease/exonuclease/phosphatase family metal-dependent hydrolase
MTAPEVGTMAAHERGDALATGALVAATTLVTLECARVLFSIAYHTGESVGWTKTGLMVVVLFAVPALGGPLRRLLPPTILLTGSVAVAVVGRLALQAVDDVNFGLAMFATGAALLALSLAATGAHRHRADGRLVAAVAVTIGVAVDVVLRAADATWDFVWRHDAPAWALTVLVLAALAAALVVCLRRGAVPIGEPPGDGLAAFLLWPYLYLVVFYAQSPAFLDSSGGVQLPVGIAVALLDAALAVLVLGLSSRQPLPRWGIVGVALALAGVAYLLPAVTGPMALALCGITQLGAAALLGQATSRDETEDETDPRLNRASLAFAGGSVLFAAATLLYTLHTIQPLPFSNRFVPAAMGLAMASAAWASGTRAGAHEPAREVATTTPKALVPSIVGVLVVLAVVVPLAVALTWPAPATVTAADRPLRVMTFNIQQGVTLGQLDLEQIAGVVDMAEPDVVMMEEVGRGWSVSGMTDEAEWLRRRLRMETAWGAAADNQFGNLVLSRVRITERDVLALGKGNGTQDRSAVFVTLDLGGGRQTEIIGTHLQNGSPPGFHETRAQEYRAILEQWSGRPTTVLIGDLNTYPRLVPPGWPELNIVLDAGFHTTQDLDQCTMPTSNANCPDWVFTTPDLHLSPVTIVVDRPDHRPIAATISPAG